MQTFSLFVGLDISKSTFNAAFRRESKLIYNGCYTNDHKGISLFIKDILNFESELDQILVAMEHCGVYLEKIVMKLHGEGVFTWLWNPVIAKHAPLDLNRHKDDDRDAKSMALLAQNYYSQAKRYIPITAENKQIKELFLLRSQLVKHRTSLLNQQRANQDKAIPNTYSANIFQELIEIISLRINEISKKLKRVIFSSKRLKRIYVILTSIPSIGPVIATQLIEITHGFTKFNSEKALAKYIGTMPLKYESGTSIKHKPRSSKRTHKPLKVNLTMGATSLIREGLFFHQFYIFKRHKENVEHFKIINTIRNTVLKLAFKLVQIDKEFDPAIFIKNKKSWQDFLILS